MVPTLAAPEAPDAHYKSAATSSPLQEGAEAAESHVSHLEHHHDSCAPYMHCVLVCNRR
jgi:hypothetical protein